MIYFWCFVYGVPIALLGAALLAELWMWFADILHVLIAPYDFFLLLNLFVCLSCLLLAVREYQQKDKESVPMAVVYLFTSAVYASFYFVTFKDFFLANYFGEGFSMAPLLHVFFYTIDILTFLLLIVHCVMRGEILEGKRLK